MRLKFFILAIIIIISIAASSLILTADKPCIVRKTHNTAPLISPISASSPISERLPEPYTEEEVFYLAAAVCREAGGASEEIQLLVANVIINRVNSEIYPNTIYEVLTQYKQYGTMWRDGISFPAWATDRVKENCYSVARRILNGERFCPENVLFQAEFVQGSGVFKEFDGYYFCYYN